MPDYFPFDPATRTPHTKAPPGTIDSQFHVLGPADRYPVRKGAAYEMPSATFAAARRVHEALGIERGIIVQTTTYGADHNVADRIRSFPMNVVSPVLSNEAMRQWTSSSGRASPTRSGASCRRPLLGADRTLCPAATG